jgi:hypothetical protein
VVLTTAACQAQLGSAVTITDNHLCMNDVSGGGVCATEEGGGVMVFNSYGFGVTSGVQGSCAGTVGGQPAVSTRIAPYLTWINNNL